MENLKVTVLFTTKNSVLHRWRQVYVLFIHVSVRVCHFEFVLCFLLLDILYIYMYNYNFYNVGFAFKNINNSFTF